ncbi:peroxidase 40-like [Glycine soja]|uniref:peroxidase 40-like n=1 Tax=Glycine soja TaxID=3848 RepID=UPI00103C5D78|nr:peroxidase 40-like [Glycine soja]
MGYQCYCNCVYTFMLRKNPSLYHGYPVFSWLLAPTVPEFLFCSHSSVGALCHAASRIALYLSAHELSAPFDQLLSLNIIAMQLVLLCLLILKLTPAFATTLNDAYGDDSSGCPLGTDIYQYTCPEAEAIIFSWVEQAVSHDSRMAASLLRLHFHDCFVNGCDGSVLLDDTQDFVGEKTAGPNLNSLRGFEVIDQIKSELELVCPQTVSCADILATAARDSVLLSGGPIWEVQMGRKDGITASKNAANNNIPGPNSTVDVLVAKFENVGLTLKDMVALSGAHTIGKARCRTFSSRFQTSSNSESANANIEFIASLQQLCSGPDNSNTVAHLDLATPATFDNQYFVNLLSGEGLLPSDQALVNGNDQTRQIVETYVENPLAFFEDFKLSMLKMGSLASPTQTSGQIRRNCRTIN